MPESQCLASLIGVCLMVLGVYHYYRGNRVTAYWLLFIGEVLIAPAKSAIELLIEALAIEAILWLMFRDTPTHDGTPPDPDNPYSGKGA
jgi:hypothetical protein